MRNTQLLPIASAWWRRAGMLAANPQDAQFNNEALRGLLAHAA